MNIKYELEYGHKFVRDLKLAKRRGLNIEDAIKIVSLYRTGTHSDLFKK